MNFFKKIIYCLVPFRFFFKKIPFLRKAVFHRGSKIINSQFEGGNVIGSNCTLLETSLGYGTYIANDSFLLKVSIGKFCSIGPKVSIGFGTHPTNFIATHPSFYSPLQQAGFTFTDDKSYFNEFKTNEYGKLVTIGNNCWLGYDVSILDGIEIGDGAIIAAKSLVTCNVPPYSIVGGVPAKIIKFRFDEKQISRILKMENLWNLEFCWYRDNYSLLHDIEKLDDLETKYYNK